MPLPAIGIGDTVTLSPWVDTTWENDWCHDVQTNFTFESSDESVATVTATGVLTAIAEGTTEITVTTDTGLTETFMVDVHAAPTAISFVETEITLYGVWTDDYTQMSWNQLPTVVFEPEDAACQVTWSVSDTALARIDDDSLVAKLPGTFTLTATTANGLTASATVTIQSDEVSNRWIEIDNDPDTVGVGDTLTLIPYAYTEWERGGWTYHEGATFTYASSNKTVATVSSAGVLKALKQGTTTITITASTGATYPFEVTVHALPTEISLAETEIVLSGTWTDNGFNSYGVDLPKIIFTPSDAACQVTWTVADDEIAEVDEYCVAGAGLGTTTLTATTSNGLTATCKVTVKDFPKAEDIVITPSSIEIGEGESIQLDVSFLNDTYEQLRFLEWMNETDMIEMDEDYTVHALAEGNTNLTLSFEEQGT